MDNCDATTEFEAHLQDQAFHPSGSEKKTDRPFRKIRTNSYHRALSTPPKTTIQSLPRVSEQGQEILQHEQDNLSSMMSQEVLYQKVKEEGISNDGDDDEIDLIPNLRRRGALRQSWIRQSQVQESGVLQKMSSQEKKRQGAMFELISSEASYLRSLNVLVTCFMTSTELRLCVTNTQHHHLFSNIEAVRSASGKFHLSLMKRRNSTSVIIDDVCDIIIEHLESKRFSSYITYCSNETYQQRVLQKLLNENEKFVEVLRRLEGSKECAGLPLHSFLLLPMQRITRLPLLIDTIRQRCDVTMKQYETASRALRETTTLVKNCNERAKSLERTEQMIQLQQQLQFKSSRSFPIVSSQRYLLKRGPIMRSSEEVVLGFRRVVKQELHLFLFNDVIMITKKSKDIYSVTDYCYKNQLSACDVIDDDVINPFILVMEKNQDGQRIEMHLEADKPNTKARWMVALKPSQSYQYKLTSDTMQVEIIRSLLTDEPDMTSLKVMDIYIVLTLSADGWIYGERLDDASRAWFPSTYAKEIASQKIRDRNLKRRSRLMGEQTQI